MTRPKIWIVGHKSIVVVIFSQLRRCHHHRWWPLWRPRRRRRRQMWIAKYFLITAEDIHFMIIYACDSDTERATRCVFYYNLLIHTLSLSMRARERFSSITNGYSVIIPRLFSLQPPKEVKPVFVEQNGNIYIRLLLAQGAVIITLMVMPEPEPVHTRKWKRLKFCSNKFLLDIFYPHKLQPNSV